MVTMTKVSFSRRVLIAVMAVVVAAGVTQADVSTQSQPVGRVRPNVLFIMTDQQSAAMLSCAGNPYLKTPALDALAAAGTRFELAYATNPVCAPSRFSLQTGRMPSAIGMRSNATMPRPPQKWCAESLGPLMKRAGYRCAYGGKPHLVPGLAEYVMKNGYENLTGDSRDKLAKECVEFIRRPDDRPFFLFASFINPHDICFMAINDLARHEGKPIAKSFDAQFCDSMLNKALASGDLEAFVSKNCPPLPPNFEPAAGEPECVRVDHLRDQPWTAYARQEWSEQRWRLHRWLYCRLTESVDAQIEVVLRSLKEAGLEEKTLVIFSSDHGEMDGAHRLEQKATLYEEAARIPFIVTWKGTLPGGKVDREHLVSNGLDLLPTVCDFAGVAPPADLPGHSVRPLIEGRAGTGWRDHLVVETKDGRMIRDDRFKYCIYEHGENRETLVDLKIDPGEMKNLIGSAEHADEVKRLQKLLFEWATRWDDRLGLAYIKH